MRENAKKILSAFSNLLFVLIVLLAVLIFYAKINNQPLVLFGRTVIFVMTPSMETDDPDRSIPAQSYILVRKASADEVNEGDVIVFYSDDPAISGSMNTHRVVRVVGDHESFITKGDANLVEDHYPARAASVFGIYEKNLPVLSALGRLLMSRVGLIFVMFCALMMCVSFFFPKKKPEKAEDPEEARKRAIDAAVQAEVERMLAEDQKKQGPKDLQK